VASEKYGSVEGGGRWMGSRSKAEIWMKYLTERNIRLLECGQWSKAYLKKKKKSQVVNMKSYACGLNNSST
jgi:hypothetical protein